MKTMLTAVVMTAMLSTGCTSLVWLQPVATEEQVLTDPALAGLWNSEDGEGVYLVRQVKNGYRVCVNAGTQDQTCFEARLFRVGEAKFLDLTAETDNMLLQPVHAVVRVWPEDATLRWAFVDSAWIRAMAAQQLGLVRLDKDRSMAPADSRVAAAFLAGYGTDSRAYTEVVTLRKLR